MSTDSKRIAKALGATRTEALPHRPAQGPLGLLQLRAEVERRIRSSGGRPTDPEWTLKRVVPFHPDRWAELEKLADRIGASDRSVSPAQLAAMLVERGLDEMKQALSKGGDDALRAVVRRPRSRRAS